MVVGLVVPPRTVGSLAITRHWVCATSASATTTPPPTGSPVCRPASGHSSSTGVPGSTTASRRSRTIILPRARWRSTYCGPPPASTCVVRARAPRRPARAWRRAFSVNSSLGVARRECGWACSRRRVPGGPALLEERRHPLRCLLPGEELGRRRGRGRQSRRPTPAAGSARNNALVARTAPGADLAERLGLLLDPGVERGHVRGHRGAGVRPSAASAR